MNVLSFMVSKKRSMGVIMDEIDGMSSKFKKGGLTELMNTALIKRRKRKNLPASFYLYK